MIDDDDLIGLHINFMFTDDITNAEGVAGTEEGGWLPCRGSRGKPGGSSRGTLTMFTVF